MAINIDIPGVGRVQVEGVASEAVMEKILDQLKSMDPKNSSSPAADANKKAAKSAEEFEKALKSATTEEERARIQSAKDVVDRRMQMEQMKASVKTFTTDLAANTTRIATSLVKMHDRIAADPISAGASLINVGIDATARAAKTTSGALLDLGSEIPVVGGVFKGLKGAAEGAIEALSAAGKIVNDILAKELAKTAESMKNFAAMGASFAGGLTELRTISGASGLNLQAFTNVVKSSRDSISGMGLTVGEAAQRIGNSMQTASVMTGRSGKTLRDEMLSMGYSYEEQGIMMSQYMANMKAAGQLEVMTKQQIAEGTRKYAADLKVLADITGEDAKKKMEEARKESMRAAIMAKMSDTERTKFMQAYASVPKEMQQSVLEYFASGGTAVTNAGGALMRATNKEFDKTLESMYSGVKNQNITASQLQDQTLNNVKAIGEEQRQLNRENGAAAAADQAVILGKVSGAAADYANMANAAAARMYGDADKSRAAAEGMAGTQDDATNGFVKATDAAMKFSVAVENIATKALPKYADILGSALQGMIDAFRKVGIDIPKTEAEIAEEKRKAAEQQSARAAAAQGLPTDSMAAEGLELPQYSDGGIAQGPESGHLAMLHGKEAVIPLGNNNKIPVELDAGTIQKPSPPPLANPDAKTVQPLSQPTTVEINNTISEAPPQAPILPEPKIAEAPPQAPILPEPKIAEAPPQTLILPEPDWYDKLSRAAMLITGSTRDSISDATNVSSGFGEAMIKYVESAEAKIKDLEQSETGRSQVAEIMKGYSETLLQLKEGRANVESGRVDMAGEGAAPMIEAQNKMITLFEQFLTKQDEAKAELERARIAQEMMRDLM